MSKILKNTTGSPIEISDTGITVPASPATFTITEQDYIIWAASEDVVTPVTSGDIVVNDGSNDLSSTDGLNFLKYPDTAANIRILSKTDKDNDFEATNLQEATEEIDYRRETREPTGFINPNINTTLDGIATIEFDDGTRTFSIIPTGASYEYFVHGKRVEISTTKSIVIDNTTGVHIIYLDDTGAITKYTGAGADKPYDGQEIKIGVVYWNVSEAAHQWMGDARSELSMTWGTQRRTHFIAGTETAATSFEFENIIINGSGALDAHAQFGLNNGGDIFHEDALWNVSNSATPGRWEQKLDPIANIPVMYREGSGNIWKKKVATDFPLYNDGANTIFWNEEVGGTWQLTNVGDKQFVAMYIFATIDPEEPIIAIMGDHAENSPAKALHTHMQYPPGLPYPAMGFIGAIIFQSSTSFTNTPHARIFAVTSNIDQTISSDRYVVKSEYTGNANTGRWLELSNGESSNTQPILVPEDSFIRTVTVQATANIDSGKKIGFFEINDLVTPRFEVTIPTGGSQAHSFDVTESFDKGERIAVQVTNGSINKPVVRFWIETVL